MSLHKALVTKWVTVPKAPHEKKNKKRKKAVGELTAESKGITTFEKFCRFILTTTHRFKCDVHRENMRAMRSTTAEHPVTLSFLKGLRPRTGNEMQNPLIRFALIGVTSNRERAAFNAAQALEFARFHGRVLVRWKLELRGPPRREIEGKGAGNLRTHKDMCERRARTPPLARCWHEHEVYPGIDCSSLAALVEKGPCDFLPSLGAGFDALLVVPCVGTIENFVEGKDFHVEPRARQVTRRGAAGQRLVEAARTLLSVGE